MAANFEHYKVFYYVAKYKNFTKAANALMTSQPSVTYCIQNLENTLECKLFVRSRKGVTLTVEGELLYNSIASACQQILKGEEKLREFLGSQDEHVNVGATQMSMRSYLVKKLNQFQQMYPQIKLDIYNHNTHHTLNELKKGAVDLAIISMPFDMEKDLNVVKVKDFETILVAGTKYADYAHDTIHLADVSDLPLISMSTSSATFAFLQDFYRTCGLTVQPMIEVGTIDLLVPTIAANLGIGFVPQELAQSYLDRGELLELKLCEDIPKRDICVVTDKKRTLSNAALKLKEVLEDREDNNEDRD